MYYAGNSLTPVHQTHTRVARSEPEPEKWLHPIHCCGVTVETGYARLSKRRTSEATLRPCDRAVSLIRPRRPAERLQTITAVRFSIMRPFFRVYATNSYGTAWVGWKRRCAFFFFFFNTGTGITAPNDTKTPAPKDRTTSNRRRPISSMR